MLFIDGIGIGENDPAKNPFVKESFNFFTKNFQTVPTLENGSLSSDGKYIFPVDANLDVEGLPQSGTGQTSIFCGMNASKFIGKHFGPYPYSTLIPIIKEENIFTELIKKDKKVFFANAYPKVFFDYINSGKQRLSVTSLSCLLSGIDLNDAEKVKEGKALTAEITNERWNRKLGYNLDIISPETAAERLLSLTHENDFTLYEYFLTDHVGHGRLKDEAENIFNNLDEFLSAIIEKIPNDITLLLCSDHGNSEDLSVKTHTRNPSLGLSSGKYSNHLSENIISLPDIKKNIVEIVCS